MAIETFVARRALANVGVAEMLRRSAVSAPLRSLLPLVFVVLLPVTVLGVVVFGAFLGSLGGGQKTAEMWAAGLSAALFLWGILWTPVLSACSARFTIRALHGARPRFGTVLRESLAALPSALPLLLVGLFWVLAHALCFFPGLLAMALVLPVGGALAVESGSLGTAWSRARALTRGQLFALAGALFVIDTVEGFGSRFVAIFTPKSLSSQYSAGDMWAYALLATVVAAAFTVWRAALGAVAYHDLRTRSEGLEPDAIVVSLGGKGVVGLDLEDQAVSSQQLGAMQKRRKTLVTVIVSGLTLALALGLGYGPVSAWWKERKDKQRFEEDWARDSQVRKELEAARKAREAELGTGAATASAFPTRPAVEPDEEVAARLRAATGARRALLARELGKRGARLYGSGYGDIFKKLETLPEGQEWETLQDRLRVAARSEGCGDALEKAEAARSARQAITFASSCPPGSEPRLLSAAQVTGVPLWAGVLATIVELRAKDRGQDKNELHRAVVETLLAERAAAP